MIGGTGMSLVCGRNRPERRMTEYQEASCSRGWMRQLETNASPQLSTHLHINILLFNVSPCISLTAERQVHDSVSLIILAK